MDFSPDKMRRRFATLSEQYDKLDAERTALQRERDGKVDTRPEKEIRAYAPQIRKLHEKIAPIEEERAMISRALNGKTSA